MSISTSPVALSASTVSKLEGKQFWNIYRALEVVKSFARHVERWAGGDVGS